MASKFTGTGLSQPFSMIPFYPSLLIISLLIISENQMFLDIFKADIKENWREIG